MKSHTIVLSIHPQHIENIFSGVKLFEYRKIVPSDVNYLIIYATAPIKKIVAIVEVDKILFDSTETIWEQTQKCSGITKEFYLSYFQGRLHAYAIKFKAVHRLVSPIPLASIGIRHAPQSFIYIEDENELIKSLCSR